MKFQEQKAKETAMSRLKEWSKKETWRAEWMKRNLKYSTHVQLWGFVTGYGWNK